MCQSFVDDHGFATVDNNKFSPNDEVIVIAREHFQKFLNEARLGIVLTMGELNALTGDPTRATEQLRTALEEARVLQILLDRVD
jgi:hypothetical protein